MIRLQKVEAKDRDLPWNINQKYLYEMTNYYDDPMDENGGFSMSYLRLLMSIRINILLMCCFIRMMGP